MRCPECGARNTAEAPWCTQCLTPLGASAPRRDDPRDEGDDPGDRPTSGVGPAPSSTTTTTGDAGPADGPDERGFRTRDGEVEWRCEECGNWNLLAVPSCAVCGHGLPGTSRDGSWSRDRVARIRRALWIVAALVCLLAVVVVVVGVVTAQGVG